MGRGPFPPFRGGPPMRGPPAPHRMPRGMPPYDPNMPPPGGLLPPPPFNMPPNMQGVSCAIMCTVFTVVNACVRVLSSFNKTKKQQHNFIPLSCAPF